MTFPDFERTSLISDPTPGKSVNDPLVLSHLVHDLARHSGDQGNQQKLWDVLKARLHQQFDRAACARCILPVEVWSMSRGIRPKWRFIHTHEVLVRSDKWIIGAIKSPAVVVESG